MAPAEQLERISARVGTLMARQHKAWSRSIQPKLAKAAIDVTGWEDLDHDAKQELRETFEERIHPVLTPLSVDPSHPFPYISNLSLNLAVEVMDPATRSTRFARVKVPPSLPRFLGVSDGVRFVPIEQVIAAHVESLFPGMRVASVYPFRVTRDADVELEIDEAEDLLAQIESILRQRERSPETVRLEVAHAMPKPVRALLREELELSETDVYVSKSLLGLSDLFQLAISTDPT